MKKLLIAVVLLFTFTLSSCQLFTINYSDFNHLHFDSYAYSLYLSHNRYVVYVYDSEDETSEDMKTDVLSFFDSFEYLEFYMIDNATADEFTTSEIQYDGEPAVYVISSEQIYESYVGQTEINEFLLNYTDIEFDYDLFESQHVTSYEEVLEYDSDSYILYYYFDSCPYCIAAKPDFLPWAFTKNAEDILFMEGSTVEHADQLPTELIILNSGTPILVLMSQGRFMDEYYSSTDPVLEYIASVGEQPILPEVMKLDYSDFAEYQMTSYSESLAVTNDLHFEYYYSVTCGHCIHIKPRFLYFASIAPIDTYFFDTSKINESVPIEGFIGTPTLYLVKDGHVIEEYIGGYSIPAMIENYLDGEIDFNPNE